MNSNSIQQVAFYLTIMLLGCVFFYFDGGLETSLTYAMGFIIFALAFGLLRKLFFKKKTQSGEYPLPEMDERIEKMSLKFMAQIFGLSHLVGAVILFVLYLTNKESTIKVEYVLGYVMIVLFFTMMFGLKIVKKLDNYIIKKE